jgi:hypothetical protein
MDELIMRSTKASPRWVASRSGTGRAGSPRVTAVLDVAGAQWHSITEQAGGAYGQRLGETGAPRRQCGQGRNGTPGSCAVVATALA